MKLFIKTFTVLFAAATLWSCNGDDKTKTETSTTDSVGTDKTANKSNAADSANSGTQANNSNAAQDFINFAVPANTKEIMWLKAAMAKATSKDIKSHSSMMLKDHNKMGADIKNYMAKNTNITMPSLDTANEVNINDKTGADWDKAWADKMVDDHQKLLDKLKSAQSDVKDSALSKIITSSIPVVESHLSMAKAVQDKLKK